MYWSIWSWSAGHNARAVMQVFQGEEIAIQKFREIIEVVDVAVLGEVRRILKFGGPHSSIRKSRWIRRCINVCERQRRRASGVSESFYAVWIAVPARIFEVVAVAIVTVS